MRGGLGADDPEEGRGQRTVLGRMAPTLELLGVACSQIFNQGLPGVLGTPLAWGEPGLQDTVNSPPCPPAQQFSSKPGLD